MPLARMQAAIKILFFRSIGSPFSFADKEMEKRYRIHFHRTAQSRCRSTLPALGVLGLWAAGHLTSSTGFVDLSSVSDGLIVCITIAQALTIAFAPPPSDRTLRWGNRCLRLSLLLKASQSTFSLADSLLFSLVDAVISCQVHPTVVECSLFFLGFCITQFCLILRKSDLNTAWEHISPLKVAPPVAILVFFSSHSVLRQSWIAKLARSTFSIHQVTSKAAAKVSTHGDPEEEPLVPGSGSDGYYPTEMWEELEEEFQEISLEMAQRAAQLPQTDNSQYAHITSRVLGEGGYGIVKLALHRSTDESLAVKLCKITAKGSSAQRALAAETASLRLLSHPNIVGFKHACFENGNLCLFLELCDQGNLKRVLKQVGLLSDETARICTCQMMSAVQYLHLVGVVHRDIKCSNFLLCDGLIKLSDFGTSVWITPESCASARSAGTPQYSAPEVLSGLSGKGHQPVTRKSDIWSLGICVLEMVTGRKLLEDELDNERRYALLMQMHKPNLGAVAGREAKDFIMCCLVLDPQERPTAHELHFHSWLQGYEDEVLAFDYPGDGEPEQGKEPRRSVAFSDLWDPSKLLEHFWAWKKDVDGVFDDMQNEMMFRDHFLAPRWTVWLFWGEYISWGTALYHALRVMGILHTPDRMANLMIIPPQIMAAFLCRWDCSLQFKHWCISVIVRCLGWLNLYECWGKTADSPTRLLDDYCFLLIGIMASQLTMWVAETHILSTSLVLIRASEYLSTCWAARYDENLLQVLEKNLTHLVIMLLVYRTTQTFIQEHMASERRKFLKRCMTAQDLRS